MNCAPKIPASASAAILLRCAALNCAVLCRHPPQVGNEEEEEELAAAEPAAGAEGEGRLTAEHLSDLLWEQVGSLATPKETPKTFFARRIFSAALGAGGLARYPKRDPEKNVLLGPSFHGSGSMWVRSCLV